MSLCLISDKSSRIQSSPKVLFVIMARERQNLPNGQSNKKSRTTLIICIFFQHTNSGGDLDDAWKNPPATCCLPKIWKFFPFLPFSPYSLINFFTGQAVNWPDQKATALFCGPYLTTFFFCHEMSFTSFAKSFSLSGMVDRFVVPLLMLDCRTFPWLTWLWFYITKFTELVIKASASLDLRKGDRFDLRGSTLTRVNFLMQRQKKKQKICL